VTRGAGLNRRRTSMKATAFGFEGMLLRWTNSSSGGPQITIQLQDEDDLVPFQNMTLAKGKQAGQRLMIGVSLIGDQETAVPVETSKGAMSPLRKMQEAVNGAAAKAERVPSKSHFPSGLTGLAVQWCLDKNWREWLAEREGESPGDEAWAKNIMCMECGISSRKMLDTDVAAATIFRSEFLEPYKEYLASKVVS
jgi:hypothetical protein